VAGFFLPVYPVDVNSEQWSVNRLFLPVYPVDPENKNN
jgi:hypothetical protein